MDNHLNMDILERFNSLFFNKLGVRIFSTNSCFYDIIAFLHFVSLNCYSGIFLILVKIF